MDKSERSSLEEALRRATGDPVRSRMGDRFDWVLRFALRETAEHECTQGQLGEALRRSAALVADTIPGRIPKQMAPSRSEDGPALEYFSADSPEQEAVQIVLRIQRLLEAGHAPGDIAILCRSLRTSGEPFRRQLERAGIAVRSSGPLSLLSCPETAIITRLFVFWAGGVWYPEHQAEMVTAARLADDLTALLSLSKTEAARRVQRVVALGERIAASDHFDLIPVLDEVFSELGLPGTGQGVEEREHGLGQAVKWHR